jgi:sugar phosphate isomerase/epimerase
MRIGYRVVSPQEVGLHDADLVQISTYAAGQDNVEAVRRCAEECQKKGVPYVVHPVGCPLLGSGTLEGLIEMAKLSDLALILHDERTPEGGRLHGEYSKQFRRIAGELARLATISFENANDSGDAPWFWSSFADSVTLDIGHMEVAGFDSVEFVNALDDSCVQKIHYVHMHHNGKWRNGLTDHWPLEEGCRELEALKALLKRKRDISVILEINETWETDKSLRLLRDAAENG